MATPLGTTLLLFLVWVFSSQSGLSCLFACCFCVVCSWILSFASFFRLFFIFLEIFYIRCFSCLQRCIYACFLKWTYIYASFLRHSRIYTQSIHQYSRIYLAIFKIFKSFCLWRSAWWFDSVLNSHFPISVVSFTASILFQFSLIVRSVGLVFVVTSVIVFCLSTQDFLLGILAALIHQGKKIDLNLCVKYCF